MSVRRLALIDCNNFYVSCEQAFNPALRNRPVVVLSNNDGCVVSRSAEAKQAGIPMGIPYFQVRKQLASIDGAVLSSNYVLYADMSRRAMRLIAEQFPEQEIYSIDECFVDLSGLSADQALIQAFKLKQHLMQCLSLPVSVGIGSTKTLAKLAASLAKRPGATGVANFSNPMSPERLAEMRQQPVGEIWGIGRRTTQSLEAANVLTVGDLLDKPVSWIRKRYSITLLRTVEELRGQDQLGLQAAAAPRQQIIASRSFGHPVYAKSELGEALATFVARAAERLRADHSLASIMQIYYNAKDPAADGDPCADAIILNLPHATDDTRLLIRQALRGLDEIYQPGLKYKKAGVVLGGIRSADIRQPGLTGLYPEAIAPSPIMKLMDHVNQRYGRDTVRIASMGVDAKAGWHMSCSRRSRRYTTALEELPVLSTQGIS
ncbi:MAG: Y-family DNA polymerase [Rhodocyclaceae bacterium]|nr:Y-family DNA polymerase [Rhodocyclaceae bacterium]